MDCLPVLQGDDGPLSDEPERIYLSMQEVFDSKTEPPRCAGVIRWRNLADETDSGIAAEYKKMACRVSNAGAGSLWLLGFRNLRQARCAVLGARECNLSVYVCFSLGKETGETLDGDNLLACLLCLQGLGIKGFGLSGAAEQINAEISKLLPYTSITFAAMPNIDQPFAAWGKCLRQLFDAGVRAIGPCPCTDEISQIIEPIVKLYDRIAVKLPPRPEDAPILLADSRNVFYLEEDFSLSESIECEVDMLARFVEQEDAGYDVLLIEIRDRVDAENFAANRDMPRAAVCFLADDPDILEICLRAYTGRALIDARSGMPEQELFDIAGRYGAMIR